MAILNTDHYPAIRQALDVTFDADLLPDATVELQIYLGAAEAEVLRRDPQAAGRTGAELAHVQNAAILLTAAYLAPAVPQLASEHFGTYSYEAQAVDWAGRARQLAARAERELQAVLNAAEQAGRPVMFTVASVAR